MKIYSFPLLAAGDTVALVTSSGSAASNYPHVVEVAMQRMRDEFELCPILSKHAMSPSISMQQRADDLHDSFQRDEVKAVFSMIGGDCQTAMIPFLRDEIFLQNPKPFFGFSDNTNFSAYLYGLGIPSFYGGAVLTQFGMSYSMHSETVAGLRWALFEDVWFELIPSREFTEDEIDWGDRKQFGKRRLHLENEDLWFHGNRGVEGRLWGGCIESLADILEIRGRFPPVDSVANGILALESSEELPEVWRVEEFLENLGRQGYLDKTVAIAHARPKAAFLGIPEDPVKRRQYRKEQREAIAKVGQKYNPRIVVVSNLDFGHTDPQYPLPIGGFMRIDPNSRKVWVHKAGMVSREFAD